MKDRYRIIGPLYDWLATIFSGNEIDRCKTAMHDRIRPGDKILFAGVGHGIDALQAGEMGADVTVVDLSETMLKKFREGLGKRYISGSIRQIHSDILDVEEFSQYDMVFANFFLNVFSEAKMAQVLEHLSKLAKPDGCLVVGDFSLPGGTMAQQLFQKVYWYIADLLFWAAAKNALHRIYDYPAHLERLGLNIKSVKRFTYLKQNCYWSILAAKKSESY